MVHARLDGRDFVGSERLPAIDARNLTGKNGMEWANRYGHFTTSGVEIFSVSFRCPLPQRRLFHLFYQVEIRHGDSLNSKRCTLVSAEIPSYSVNMAIGGLLQTNPPDMVLRLYGENP
ncbi:MAG: hypothetical protein JOY83_16700 [Alphaproteobacteria bacterium]|nr:hypothetical protein [Alphaproteobacteria bacterium]